MAEKFLERIDTKFGTKSEIHFKDSEQIVNKANRASIKESKEWFEIEHVRDAFRFRTPVENLDDLPKIVKEFADSGFTVIKPDTEKLLAPKARGWRMAAIDLRAPNGRIVEYQILPREMYEAGNIEHQAYEKIRGKDLRKLTEAERVERRELNNRARNLYQDAWEAYLRRTGQTEMDVQKFVEAANKAMTH